VRWARDGAARHETARPGGEYPCKSGGGDSAIAVEGASALNSSTRWLVGILSVTAVLVVASVAVALLGDREADLPEGTPQAAVQAYLRAVADGDSTAAMEWYSPELLERCEPSYLRDSLRWGPGRFRATLGEVIARDGAAEVRVTVIQTYGDGPFGRSESRFEQSFFLEEYAEGWRFVEPPWPTYCPIPVRP
jgi:hypothetical protein